MIGKELVTWCRSRQCSFSVKWVGGHKAGAQLVVAVRTRHVIPRYGKRVMVEKRGGEDDLQKCFLFCVDEMNKMLGMDKYDE